MAIQVMRYGLFVSLFIHALTYAILIIRFIDWPSISQSIAYMLAEFNVTIRGFDYLKLTYTQSDGSKITRTSADIYYDAAL